jgi:exonuclease SbcC
LNREKEELHSAEVQLSKALADINHLEKLIHTLAEEETLSKNRVEQLQEKVTSLQRDIEELSLPTPPSKSQEMLEKEIKELEALEISLRKEEGKLSNKLEDYHHIHENGVCPTCDREAEPNEFISKIESASILRDQASRKVQECLKTLENAKDMLKERRRHDEAQRDVERLRSQEHDYNEEVQRQQEKIASYQRESTDAADRLTVAKNTERILKETSINLAALNEQIKAAEEELTVVVKEVHTAETTITNCETQIQDYETELMIKEKKRERAEILGEYQIWVDDYFIPTLNLIEKHVMLNINQDFDSRFQRWFSILIDDPGKEARIDEDFTPIVEQDGYEQEINYLSGGEKTSGALAYRLALNSIVQKVSTGMQSNLIILDEPTDGFSKEQLSKVREILDELQSPQVILVSHERELESFADQIYRVTKSDGESKVTLAS